MIVVVVGAGMVVVGYNRYIVDCIRFAVGLAAGYSLDCIGYNRILDCTLGYILAAHIVDNRNSFADPGSRIVGIVVGKSLLRAGNCWRQVERSCLGAGSLLAVRSS